MSGASERIITPISTQELERRWAAARKIMSEPQDRRAGDAESNDWLAAMSNGSRDIPATNGYPKTVISTPANR